MTEILLSLSIAAFFIFLVFSPNRKWGLLAFALFVSNVTKSHEPLTLIKPFEILRNESRLFCLLAIFLLLFFYRKKDSGLGIKPPPAFLVLMMLQFFLLGVDFFRISFVNEPEIYQRCLIDSLFLVSVGMWIPTWIRNFEDVKWFFRSIVGATFFFIVATVIQLLSDPTQAIWNARLYGVASHPNFAAVMLSIPVPICLWLSQVARKRIEKCFWIFLMLICLIGLIWTGSRTGFLMTFVGVCVYVFATRRVFIPIVLGLLFIPFLGLLNFLPQFAISLDRVFHGQNTRLEAWHTLWSQFSQNLLFGLPSDELKFTEDSYLLIGLRGGIVGLILLLLVWFLIFGRLKYLLVNKKPFLRNGENLVLACFMAYFTGSIFEGYMSMTIGYQIIVFYCLITILYRLSRVTEI